MQALRVKLNKGWVFGVWLLPPSFPHQIDILIDQNKKLVRGWIVTNVKAGGMARAMRFPEGMHRQTHINLLTQGVFIGVYENRQRAAERLADVFRVDP